jgi:hypothetical protein
MATLALGGRRGGGRGAHDGAVLPGAGADGVQPRGRVRDRGGGCTAVTFSLLVALKSGWFDDSTL